MKMPCTFWGLAPRSMGSVGIIPCSLRECIEKNFRVTENILLFVTAAKAATTWNDFIERRRKALRRCPDLSRKRDGIVVSALSFLSPPLYWIAVTVKGL